jgi:hypothetical protein
MIYACPAPEEPVDQGDIIEGCPLTFLVRDHLDDRGPAEVEYIPTRVLIRGAS